MSLPLDHIRKIAIFRALYLGDLLCVTPALRALRQRFPQAEITLVGLPWAAGFVERYPRYLDRFISFPGYAGLPEQEPDAEALQRFLLQMREERFDLVLQMHGQGYVVNLLVQMFGAVYTAGFYPPGPKDPQLRHFIPYPDGLPELRRHLRLLAALGVPPQGDHLEFPLTEADRVAVGELPLPPRGQPYVCVHPGARSPRRRWPPPYFAALADHCSELGYAVVITGTAAEVSIGHEVRKYMKRRAWDLTGRTSLGAAGMVIGGASALITNCTGASHVADALDTPSIVISMDGEPQRWGPLDGSLHKVIDWKRQPRFGEAFAMAAAFLQGLPAERDRRTETIIDASR